MKRVSRNDRSGLVLPALMMLAAIAWTQMDRGQAQLPVPTLEELSARVEVLRAQQQVMASDALDFRADVAAATTEMKTQMTTEFAAVAAIAIPVGGVVAWWGDVAVIPANFELCDGGPPTTPGALLASNKPDLQNRFIRGATSEVGATGGIDVIESGSTDPHQLTIAEMPSHAHSWRYGLDSDDSGYGSSNSEFTTNGTATSLSPILATGGSQPHSHGIPGHDNRPAYCELLYIIRVK